MGNLVSNSVCVPPPLTAVTFTLNGRVVTVDNASPLISLNDWLRSQPGLTGTKKMCGEGGCGVCVVAVTITNPATDREISLAINSVLYYVFRTFTHGNSILGVILMYITHGNSILCVILMYITHGNSILCVILMYITHGNSILCVILMYITHGNSILCVCEIEQ